MKCKFIITSVLGLLSLAGGAKADSHENIQAELEMRNSQITNTQETTPLYLSLIHI